MSLTMTYISLKKNHIASKNKITWISQSQNASFLQSLLQFSEGSSELLDPKIFYVVLKYSISFQKFKIGLALTQTIQKRETRSFLQ